MKWLRNAAGLADGRWFDATRHVDTCGIVRINTLTLAGPGKSGFDYLPARPGRAKQALADLPLKNPADYTFIDLGSGKGRILFLAAEYPFRRILGVEFGKELHESAKKNIQAFRYRGRQCNNIESVHMDASDYQFPNENLAIHFFNPFGPNVMEKVLANLKMSLLENPRHVTVTMLYPEFAHMLAGVTDLRPYRTNDHYHIYQTRDLIDTSGLQTESNNRPSGT